MAETGRTGWYLRVLEEGHVWAGAECRWVERPCAGWSIARLVQSRHDPNTPREDLEWLANCPWLDDTRRERFAQLAARRREV